MREFQLMRGAERGGWAANGLGVLVCAVTGLLLSYSSFPQHMPSKPAHLDWVLPAPAQHRVLQDVGDAKAVLHLHSSGCTHSGVTRPARWNAFFEP